MLCAAGFIAQRLASPGLCIAGAALEPSNGCPQRFALVFVRRAGLLGRLVRSHQLGRQSRHLRFAPSKRRACLRQIVLGCLVCEMQIVQANRQGLWQL